MTGPKNKSESDSMPVERPNSPLEKQPQMHGKTSSPESNNQGSVGGQCNKEAVSDNDSSNSGANCGTFNSEKTKAASVQRHKVVFKPMAVEKILKKGNVKCYERPNSIRIKRVYIPANMTDPEEIGRVLQAAGNADAAIDSQVKNGQTTWQGQDSVLVEQVEADQLASLAKAFEIMTIGERIARINMLEENKVPMPPISFKSLKELEVPEIVKNPQLRHDVVFDPVLQFRPNLEGNLGDKRKHIADMYWDDLENEIYVYHLKKDEFNYKRSRLIPMFDSFRIIVLTIVAPKEHDAVNRVLNTEMNVKGIVNNSLDIASLADWLINMLAKHCAPMRDDVISTLRSKFDETIEDTSLHKFVETLRCVFEVLEKMRLDIANHQIKLLRPALLSNTIEFERQHILTILSVQNNKLIPSFDWFKKKFNEDVEKGLSIKGKATCQDVFRLSIRNILSLTSCANMTDDYPLIFATDKTRLVWLRSYVREVICLMICRLLFKQLVFQDKNLDTDAKNYIFTNYPEDSMASDVVVLVLENKTALRWTKNTMSVAVHLNKVINDLEVSYQKQKFTKRKIEAPKKVLEKTLDNKKIEFSNKWLLKQIQPSSPVYKLLESRTFKCIEDIIYAKSNCTVDGNISHDFLTVFNRPKKSVNLSQKGEATGGASNSKTKVLQEEMLFDIPIIPDSQDSLPIKPAVFRNLLMLAYTISTFHWTIVGKHYLQSLGDSIKNSDSI